MIDGLLYLPRWLDSSPSDDLARALDAQPWRDDLARRTQHYGYLYDYRARTVDKSAYLGPLPPFLEGVSTRLVAEGLMPSAPDQAIVNEYEPGQGIADHVDCTPCFDGTIISLSLGSSAVMTLKRGEAQVPVLLEVGSLLVLRGEARYGWTHGIAKRKVDSWNGTKIPRGRRVSVTFRKVLVSAS